VTELEEAKTLAELKKFADELQRRIKRTEKLCKHVPGSGVMHKVIPTGKRPTAMIDHMKVEAQDFGLILANLQSATTGMPERACPPGTYARLLTLGKDGWEIMMTDAPYEMRSSRAFITHAHGHVLVAGLGLGATLPLVLKKRMVKSVTVIEKNPDVVALVYPHLRNSLKMDHALKLNLVTRDAATWSPSRGSFYQTIWLDIWPTVSAMNLIEMRDLETIYSQWLDPNDPGAWLGCWEKKRCLQLATMAIKARKRDMSSVGGDPLAPFPKTITVGGKKVKI
jgi:hypothetical protein